MDVVYQHEVMTGEVSTSGSEDDFPELPLASINDASSSPRKQRTPAKGSPSKKTVQAATSSVRKQKTEQANILGPEDDLNVEGEDGDTTAPKKRKKQVRPISETIYRVVPVPTDPATGQVILPFSIGVHTIHSLGTIVWDRPAYHNKRYIMPVGYHSSRQYPSTIDAEGVTTWHSKILDGGNAPLFEVYAEDDPEHPFRGNTSTGVWSTIMRQTSALRNRDPAGSASGPDFFGLGNATVAMLIEKLDNADKCLQYEKKRFEMSAKGHAAVPVPTSDAIDVEEAE